MRTEQFLWEEVFSDSAKILVYDLFQKPGQLLKAAALYEELQAWYLREGKSQRIPNQTTYSRKLHKKLGVPYEQRIYGNVLYHLIGMYCSASVSALAAYLSQMPTKPEDVPCYLFLSVEKSTGNPLENPKTFAELCAQLREELPDGYQLLSCDEDTIVVICPNPEARKALRKFLLVLQGSLVYTQHSAVG